MMEVTCKECGWVHFAMTRTAAEKCVKDFTTFYDTLTPKQKKDHYGNRSATIEEYERCFFCRGTSFRPARAGDCPDGCTLQPTIWEPEEEK